MNARIDFFEGTEIKANTAPMLFSTEEPTPVLSVIVPAYNEETVLPLFHQRLKLVLEKTKVSYEIIYINDGSKDATLAILKVLKNNTPQIGIIDLSRNFGKEQAMSAGLAHAKGEAIIIIDADLQDPPELIPKMLAAWQAGADVVNMQRASRAGETWLKKTSAQLFYKSINRLSEVNLPENVGDFRLLSRTVVDAINTLPEKSRYMKGIFAWVGFNQVSITYDRDARAAGISKWNYWKLWNFALEAVTGFSTIPLKIASYLGLMSALFSMLYGGYFLLKTLLVGETVAGFPTLIITVLFLGGLQLMATGILGEYLSRLFVESKNRPLYIVKSTIPPQLTNS